MSEHNHRGPDPCPVCGYDGTAVASPLHPTEIRNGLQGIAKARAAIKGDAD